jgi:hypothetical protein
MKLIFLFFPLLFLGCSGEQPTATPTPVNSPATVPGTSLDSPENDYLQNPGALKGYPVGRYEDPNDPAVMHEAHMIYRAEQPATWNLNPTVGTAVPLGPTVAVTDPAKQTEPLPGELEQLLQTTYEQNERLTEELKKLQGEVAKMQAVEANNAALQRQINDLQAALAKLQPKPTKANPSPSTNPTTERKQ